ncbi:MAG: aspartate aminotransferase family protein [Flavobacteriales bacterium]|jgi:acetylornithine/succinyldiaminopimelate/putrescine aminotransferase|uniref:aspartate aminotransferase family protein n=1 Tax=Blattabacterium sp. (Mastotermes darwiniensis) TaxID=39768 RepID=UPI000231DF3C|nr:aspartate aminotransferase family protein [Blattabacterium sp. (Mastotermes darwiniensis)]AER40345.1 acetylornithine aminotransferase [Blattabacterium sp. (Mastotermes darwiniensis) str. MADAR]MDR1804934.1 aspartate aminotransferase family protein [Flavobacteriales bacterium]
MKELENDFIQYQAQVTSNPMKIVVDHAEGNYIYGKDGKKYLDFVAGVSVNTLGHGNKKIKESIKNQLEKYLHTMVYGEFVQEPCVRLCQKLSEITPYPLTKTYLVNSGTEAVEGALKLAKCYTGREEIISCKLSYHGSTQGSMSVMGYEKKKRPFRPLIPLVKFITFNQEEELIDSITNKTACVILETIQSSAGIVLPTHSFLKEVKKQCKKKNSLMILDEIQTGFGRTGKFFAFEHYGIVPDILIMGKGMGGGIPIGGFMSSNEIMKSFYDQVPLGHLTTFGGNALAATASLTTLNQLNESNIIDNISIKEKWIRKYLVHDQIKNIHGKGLLLSFELKNKNHIEEVLQSCIKKGLILFRFLFNSNSLRISPPLTITKEEIQKGCSIIIECLNDLQTK